MKMLLLSLLVLSMGVSNVYAAGKPDPKKIANGKFLFEDWGCTGCHGIGTYGAANEDTGPNLKGLYKRRSEEWVKKFSKNPAAMIESGDKDAVEMSKKFNGKVMKTFRISEEEWGDIYEFVKSKGGK